VRAKRQAGLTVADICEWYLREAAAGQILGRRGRPIKSSTLETDEARIRLHVLPLIGKRPVQTLSIRDMEEMQAQIAAGKTAARKPPPGVRPLGGIATGGNGVAGRTLAMLRAIFEHAVRRQMIASNPAKGARKLANGRRTTRLNLDQLRAFGKAMRASNENPTALAAIRLIAQSGLRRGEALGLRSDWLMEAGGIDFPDTKTGPQIRPIGRSAVETIKAQISRNGGLEWVFPADRGDGHFVGLPKVLARLCDRAALPPTSVHTLRHTYASIAAELGFSELTIAGLLGHAAGSVTAGYVHLDSALVSAADRVSAVIARTLHGEAGADVVPMQSGAG
jgi:integrase